MTAILETTYTFNSNPKHLKQWITREAVAPRLFTVRPDWELEEYNYHSRTAQVGWKGLKSTPMTCPLRESVGGSKPTPVKLNAKWINFLRAINTKVGYKWVIARNVAWFNVAFPKAETLAMGSGLEEPKINYVSGYYVNPDWVAVRTFKLSDNPPPVAYVKDTYRHMIHRMNVINDNDGVFDGKPGGAWLFLISLTGTLYVPSSRLREV